MPRAHPDQTLGPSDQVNRSHASKAKQPLEREALLKEICAEIGTYPSKVKSTDYFGGLEMLARQIYAGIAVDVMGLSYADVGRDLGRERPRASSSGHGWYKAYLKRWDDGDLVHTMGVNGWNMQQIRWVILSRFDVANHYKNNRTSKKVEQGTAE